MNVCKKKCHVVLEQVVQICLVGLNVHVQCRWLVIHTAHMAVDHHNQSASTMLIVNQIKNATPLLKSVMVSYCHHILKNL